MANKYQKCVARALKGKHFRGKTGRLAAFKKAAKKCAKACKPKNKKACKR
jgi:hypothetical protein